jgi:hypothetical protein
MVAQMVERGDLRTLVYAVRHSVDLDTLTSENTMALIEKSLKSDAVDVKVQALKVIRELGLNEETVDLTLSSDLLTTLVRQITL